MRLELFINFNGECGEAVEFYAKVFKTEVSGLMKYGDVPPVPNHATPDADKNKVLYAGVKIGEVNVMFCDVASGADFAKGNNINPTVSMDSFDEVRRVFDELKSGGEVKMPLQKTFFSDLYGIIKDKFGITWQILHYAGNY